MAFHELAIRSIRRFTMFVAVFASISIFVPGCFQVAGENTEQETSVEATLNSLMLESHELHESLRTRKIGSIRA